MGILRRFFALTIFTSFCTLLASVQWQDAENLAATHINRVFILRRSKRRSNLSSIFGNINSKLTKFYQLDPLNLDLTDTEDSENDISDLNDTENQIPESDTTDIISSDIVPLRNDINESDFMGLELIDWILTFISGIYIVSISYGEFTISLINNLTKLSKRTEFIFHIFYKIILILYYILRSKIKYIIYWYSSLNSSNKIIVSTIFYTLCMAASLRASLMLISTNYQVIFKCTTFCSIIFCQALIILHLEPIVPFILFFSKNAFGILWSILILLRILNSTPKIIQHELEPITKKKTTINKQQIKPTNQYLIRELSCLLEFWLVITCIDMIPLLGSLSLLKFFFSHVILFYAIESLFHVYIANRITEKWINLSLGTFRHMVIKAFDLIICLITGWHDVLGSRCSVNSPKETFTLERWRNSIIGYSILAVQSCLSHNTVTKVKESSAWTIINFIIFHAPQIIFLILPRFVFNVYVYYTMILKPIISTTITLETDPLGNMDSKIDCLVLSVLSFITRLIINNGSFKYSTIIPSLCIVLSNKFISTLILSLFKEKKL